MAMRVERGPLAEADPSLDCCPGLAWLGLVVMVVRHPSEGGTWGTRVRVPMQVPIACTSCTSLVYLFFSFGQRPAAAHLPRPVPGYYLTDAARPRSSVRRGVGAGAGAGAGATAARCFSSSSTTAMDMNIT